MQKFFSLFAFVLFLTYAANAQPMRIIPFSVDTDQFGAAFKSHLVKALWSDGIGCPTNSKTFNGSTSGSFTDPGCPTKDPLGDGNNDGFLLSKNGPTGNFAAAAGDFINESGRFVTELGYDIRKGSACGAGAPRFNVTLQDGSFYFVGCASPPPTITAGQGWDRLRWGSKAGNIPVPAFDRNGVLTTIPTNIKLRSLTIVFDEGTDSGVGFALIDNVDLGGVLVGKAIR